MCYECINKMKKMSGGNLPRYPEISEMSAQEQYFINGWQHRWTLPSASALNPGQGVTVIDKTDPNHKRDGFVRNSTPGLPNPHQDTNEYNVWFEPGEPDHKYKGTQIEPNDQQIDPGKMPPRA